MEVQIAYDTSVSDARRSYGSKRAYQEGAAFVVADELPIDLFRRRQRVAPSQELWQSTCSGGTRAMVLAGHLLNSLVRNIEIRRERLVSRYQQKCQQNERLERTFANVFNVP